ERFTAFVDASTQQLGGQGQAYRGAQALAQRSRGGFYALGVTVLGMTRGLAPPLAELLEVLAAHRVASEVERRVQKHRRVTAREHETVAVEPLGILRIVAQVAGEDIGGDAGQSHGRTRMSTVGL